jgi:hypothetical protein
MIMANMFLLFGGGVRGFSQSQNGQEIPSIKQAHSNDNDMLDHRKVHCKVLSVEIMYSFAI